MLAKLLPVPLCSTGGRSSLSWFVSIKAQLNVDAKSESKSRPQTVPEARRYYYYYYYYYDDD